MNNRIERSAELLRMAHELGNPRQPLSILGEGNVSTRLAADRFLVKASGTNLATLKEDGVVECKPDGLLALMERTGVADDEIEAALMASRIDGKAKKPSVEALFHAWLLTLPGVDYVGHTHAPSVNSILCSPRAKEFAEKRIFPDEVVCCDVESVFLEYTDPGLRLSQGIRDRTTAFVKKHGRIPRVILLENHGIITIGATVEAVLAAMFIAEKAATIWLGAAALGGPKFMPAEQVARIAGRPDEEVRRKVLKM